MRIAVVGAGVVGTAVAWELTARGHEAVLIDRCDAVAQETSYANGAQLHAGHAAPWNPPGVLRDALAWLGKADSPLRVNPLRVLRAPAWSLRFLANATAERYRRHADANAALALYGLRYARAWRDELGLALEGHDSGILKLFDDHRALAKGREEAEAVAALGIRHRLLDAAELLIAIDAALELDRPITPDCAALADHHVDARAFVEGYQPYY
ncbi:MAG: FAD-dependent oxidoreductase [Halorhodospira sp.]